VAFSEFQGLRFGIVPPPDLPVFPNVRLIAKNFSAIRPCTFSPFCCFLYVLDLMSLFLWRCHPLGLFSPVRWALVLMVDTCARATPSPLF